jgi:hypothetical protein
MSKYGMFVPIKAFLEMRIIVTCDSLSGPIEAFGILCMAYPVAPLHISMVYKPLRR